jgi:hypothetical protein
VDDITVVMNPWTWRETLRVCVCDMLQYPSYWPYHLKPADSPTGHTADGWQNQQNIRTTWTDAPHHPAFVRPRPDKSI